MGLNYYVAREVLRGRAGTLPAIATIGQLQQFLLPAQARRLCADFSLDPAAVWSTKPYGSYGNDFLRAVGAKRVTVIDASPYEGADVIHDMNLPVNEDLHQAFDIVVDGGSLEHIFRPDQALANVMRMVRVGGSAIIWTPANNLCGHGFYQFSPEFFFSALNEERGFRVETVLLVECVYPGVSLVAPKGAYRVRSPREVRSRVGMVSRRPVMLLVRAVKTAHFAEPLAQTPQQSDYESQWERGESLSAGAAHALRDRVRATRVGAALMRRALGIAEKRRFSLRNRAFFIPERPSRAR
ncbi:MAG: hypothetical protein QOG15_1512 [Solirubrobacteraceae bacterium]|jgi:SAM-dependent methyltransferase|nr:hypothetical protein [Solirubrobacteraceae bacterium]